MTFDELIYRVENWGHSKNLIHKDNVRQQMLKVVEEVGELSAAILRKDENKTIDSIGDAFVTLIILSAQLDINPNFALEQAYNEIKNRTGRTQNGTFIKDQDSVQ